MTQPSWNCGAAGRAPGVCPRPPGAPAARAAEPKRKDRRFIILLILPIIMFFDGHHPVNERAVVSGRMVPRIRGGSS